MISYSQKLKIQNETRENYGDAEVKTLKMILFLTLSLRTLFTKTAIFISLGIIPFIVCIWFLSAGASYHILWVTVCIHFLIYKLTLAWFIKDGMSDDYEEQNIIYRELKTMIDEKKLG